MAALKQEILHLIDSSRTRLTLTDIQKAVLQSDSSAANHASIKPRKKIKEAVRQLFDEGTVEYTYFYGNSYIERSFHGKVKISKQLSIVPANYAGESSRGEKVIRIKPGAAFGHGGHPTTRLALRMVDLALENETSLFSRQVIDIGTGSGVLAIAAILLGIGSGIGLDLNPIAIAEARENASLNQIEDKLLISDKSIDWCVSNNKSKRRVDGENFLVDSADDSFFLAVANLRLPSLSNLLPEMDRLTTKGSKLVLSGIKIDEADILVEEYSRAGFLLQNSIEEKGWAGLLLIKS